MTTSTEKRLANELIAVEAAARCELSSEAREVLTADQKVAEFVECLVKLDHLDDAIRVWAAALPVRSAIWWGATCVWETYREDVSRAADEGFRCLVEWTEDPTDTRRRKAMEMVKPVGAATPLGVLLHALFNSGGSISRPELPKFEPDVRLYTKLLAESVLLTATRLSMTQQEDRRPEFIARAAQVADGSIPVAELNAKALVAGSS